MVHASERKSIKILIVEDEPLTAMSMQMELGKRGYDAYKMVSSGADAVDSVKTDRPDVVLMDIRLVGDMDGIEAGCQIRMFSEVPIIFMTGYSDKNDREEIKKNHPLALLDKPVLISEISNLIASVFD